MRKITYISTHRMAGASYARFLFSLRKIRVYKTEHLIYLLLALIT